MNSMEHKSILIETTKEYPAYYRDKILKKLKGKGLIFNDKRSKNEKALLDVSNMNDSFEKLKYIIENLENSISEVEEFEYERAYRYCSIFTISNYSDSILERLDTNGQIRKFAENNDYLSVNGIYPTYKVETNKTILKFSFLYKSKDGNDTRIKYPVLAIIHKDLNILEIRFDTIPFSYKSSESFYMKVIGNVKSWITSVLNLGISESEKEVTVDDINFQAVVKYMRDEKIDEVTIVALKMRRNGMVAYLDASANEELTIPILGELKELLKNNRELLDTCPDIRNLLYGFINKIEDTSDLPSVKILWHEKKVKVLLTHNYQGETYTLFKYYDELNDTEMMNYVTEYLISCKKENDKLFED